MKLVQLAAGAAIGVLTDRVAGIPGYLGAAGVAFLLGESDVAIGAFGGGVTSHFVFPKEGTNPAYGAIGAYDTSHTLVRR